MRVNLLLHIAKMGNGKSPAKLNGDCCAIEDIGRHSKTKLLVNMVRRLYSLE